jgi:hypothetical protein
MYLTKKERKKRNKEKSSNCRWYGGLYIKVAKGEWEVHAQSGRLSGCEDNIRWKSFVSARRGWNCFSTVFDDWLWYYRCWTSGLCYYSLSTLVLYVLWKQYTKDFGVNDSILSWKETRVSYSFISCGNIFWAYSVVVFAICFNCEATRSREICPCFPRGYE